MTAAHRAILERMRSSTSGVRQAVERAQQGRFATPPRAGEWSSLETLTHLRDVVVHVYGLRIRRLLYEDAPVFADFDEAGYRAASLARGEVARVPILERGRWGFIDSTGRVAVKTSE